MTTLIPRYDFFQTSNEIIISIYIKNVKQDQLTIEITSKSLRIKISLDQEEQIINISPLFFEIDSKNSKIRCLNSKIEITLPKQEIGIQWPKLIGNENDQKESITSSSSSSKTTTNSNLLNSVPKRSKWDSFIEIDDEEMINKYSNGEENSSISNQDNSIDTFFKELYEQADDDTKRAMMKSFTESNGTNLSTNWEEVKKNKVETKPPQGVEARKWGT